MGELGKGIEWWDYPGQKRDFLRAQRESEEPALEIPPGLDITFVDGFGFEDDYPRIEPPDENDSSWESEL